MDNFDYIKYLAEGKLYKNEPINETVNFEEEEYDIVSRDGDWVYLRSVHDTIVGRKEIKVKEEDITINEGFTKHDWDVKWKTPKDNLFNVTKTVDSVNNRYKAIQDLLKLNPKELQAFDATDDHPAYDMSYDELMRWYYQIMKESVNEEQLKKGDVLIMKATGQKWKIVRPHGDGYYVRISGENSMGWHPSDWFDMMLRTKKAAIEGGIKESVNEEEYPHSAPRVYVVMLGNKGGPVGPYRVYADKSTAEAEAAQQKENSKQLGSDIRAFVQDLAYIK